MITLKKNVHGSGIKEDVGTLEKCLRVDYLDKGTSLNLHQPL